MEKLRCLNCAKVLGEGDIETGIYRKICPKCKLTNQWEFIEIISLIGDEFNISRSVIQKLVKK